MKVHNYTIQSNVTNFVHINKWVVVLSDVRCCNCKLKCIIRCTYESAIAKCVVVIEGLHQNVFIPFLSSQLISCLD